MADFPEDVQRRMEAVDGYFAEVLGMRDPVLDAVIATCGAEGLPPIQVPAALGRLLGLLVLTAGARSIVEVGTLGGYSTIHLARAAMQTGGRVISLELSPRHADVARRNIAAAGLADVAEVRTGPARELMAALGPADGAPFDLFFIDADKASIPAYLARAIGLSHPGTLIVVDNVVRHGSVADDASDDPNVRGVREFLEMVRTNPRLSGTAIQTVGAKGWDGFSVVRVG